MTIPQQQTDYDKCGGDDDSRWFVHKKEGGHSLEHRKGLCPFNLRIHSLMRKAVAQEQRRGTELTRRANSLQDLTKHMSKDQERAAQDLYFAIKSSRPDDHDSSIAMTTKLFFERHGGNGAVEIIVCRI